VTITQAPGLANGQSSGWWSRGVNPDRSVSRTVRTGRLE